MIDWIISALAIGIAILALLLDLYWRVRNIRRNDIKHAYEKIDSIEEDVTEVKERLAGLERDVAWLRERCDSG